MTSTTNTSALRAILKANRMPIGTDIRGLSIPIRITQISIIGTSTEHARDAHE
jgi:hypothetical protein